MKRLFWRLAPEVVLVSFLFLFLGAGAGGCNPNNDVKAGPPELETFSVIDNVTGQPVEITGDAGPVEIGGYVHLYALFDRLIDSTAIANPDGSSSVGLLATIMISPVPTRPITYTSDYTPNGSPPDLAPGVTAGLVFGRGPTIVTSADPTFPSSATITATLDKTKILSKKGEPFAGEGQLVFHTLPFAASIGVPEGTADPDAGADAGADAGPPPVKPQMQPVTITFTNRVGSDIASHISVTSGGGPFAAVEITADDSNPTLVTVTPTTTWPASSTLTVTVDATAADALGSTTGTAATASFTTGSN